MASQAELDSVYMGTAILHAKLSKAKRLQVGACIVTSSGVCLTGYNGTPAGWDNACEDSNNVTKPEVIHAEINAILKAAREGVSLLGSTIYITHSPCLPCAAKIAQAGVSRVCYNLWYRDDSGIKALLKAGITVDQVPILTINSGPQIADTPTDPCQGCAPRAVCRTPSCGRLKRLKAIVDNNRPA